MAARILFATLLVSALQGCMLAALPIWPASGMTAPGAQGPQAPRAVLP